MKTPLAVTAVLAVACLAGGYALGRASVAPGLLGHEPRKGPELATFRGGGLSRAKVEDALARQPESFREQLRTPAAKKALVEEMVRFELFAAEGERASLARDPVFLERYKDLLGRAWIEKAFEAPQRKAAPTDAEVRAFFDQNRAALGRPMRARIAVVQYAAPAADAAARSAARAKAEAALAKLRSTRDDYAFARVATAESQEPRSRLTNGELPFMARDELAARLGTDVATAAFEAPIGAVVPRVVEDEKGVHVVKVLAREEGYEPAFDEVKDAIRTRLAAERRTAAYEQFLKQLWESAAVKVDEKAVEALQVD